MTIYANVSGTWRDVTAPYVNVSGTWRAVENAYANVSGTWREVYSSGPSVIGEFYGGGYYVGEVSGHKIIAAPENSASYGNVTFQGAIDACAALTLNGYSDWLSPTYWELEAVCNWGNTSTGSGEYGGYWYWSSTLSGGLYYYKRFPAMANCSNGWTATPETTMNYLPIRRV